MNAIKPLETDPIRSRHGILSALFSAGLAVLCMAILAGGASVAAESVTIDEVAHIRAGGKLICISSISRFNPEHPPASKVLAAFAPWLCAEVHAELFPSFFGKNAPAIFFPAFLSEVGFFGDCYSISGMIRSPRFGVGLPPMLLLTLLLGPGILFGLCAASTLSPLFAAPLELPAFC